jgi:hypothetical protein
VRGYCGWCWWLLVLIFLGCWGGREIRIVVRRSEHLFLAQLEILPVEIPSTRFWAPGSIFPCIYHDYGTQNSRHVKAEAS